MNENQEYVIEIENLSKEYKMFNKKMDRLVETVIPAIKKHNTFKAMEDFNLKVKKGEILGVLGKNGAGKSKLLKMITGVVTPTSGSIKIKGKISSLLELGTAFNMDLTGIENIYQHGQVMGLTREQIELKKQEIIDFADIGEHLYQPVKTYSSGMFARLAFACAINVDPDILIVDEVLSVGDMAFQLKCFKKFQQFKEKGKTILFVTHSVADILKNCTSTIIIDSGKKIFEGNVKDGVEKYKKIIVGINENADKKQLEERQELLEQNEKYLEEDNLIQNMPKKGRKTWKEHFSQNPNIVEYGNKYAEVVDYGMFDEKGNYLQMLENDKEVILKSKIKFNKKVKNPIFTLTVKDFQGNDICGTNTLIEKIYTGEFEKNDEVIVEFKQKIPIAPGKYTLSFSCTQFNSQGKLEVLDRKYDALLIEVLSTKDYVGMVMLNSKINIKRIK